MQIVLILLCIVIWASMFLFYWKHPVYEWLDNKLDLQRFRRKKEEKTCCIKPSAKEPPAG